MQDHTAVTRDLAAMVIGSVLRESRANGDLQRVTERLTWRATAPLRSMTVARGLARLPGRFRSARPVTDVSEVLLRWRSSPEYWDLARELREPETGSSVGVLVHLHYPELWEPLRIAIAAIPGTVRVLVTATPDAFPHLSLITQGTEMVELVEVPNVGRDMGAFFTALDLIHDRPEWRQCDALLRLHGKRSPHLPDGGNWRESLVGGLTTAAPAVVRAFSEDQRLAVAGDLVSPRVNGELEATRSRFTTDWEQPQGFDWTSFRARPFPVGGMFWFRPQLVDEYRSLGVTIAAFARDARNATDGQTPHLLERIVGWWPAYLGYGVVDALALMDDQVLLRALADSPERARQLVQSLAGSAELLRSGADH